MALDTHSSFLYGYQVTESLIALDFDEGSGEVQATIPIGAYTFDSLSDAIASAMNDVAVSGTYTVTANRSTLKYTIASDITFDLLTLTGTRAASGIWSLIGFSTAADKTGATSYLGDTATGSLYTTQFKLQSYVPPEHQTGAASAVVNRAANGTVEVVKFGNESFIDMNFKFITDRTIPSGAPIRSNASGVSDFLDFIGFMTTKAPFEFMPDEDVPATFYSVICESTPGFSDGTGFKLMEMTSQKLIGYYDSGMIKLRVLE